MKNQHETVRSHSEKLDYIIRMQCDLVESMKDMKESLESLKKMSGRDTYCIAHLFPLDRATMAEFLEDDGKFNLRAEMLEDMLYTICTDKKRPLKLRTFHDTLLFVLFSRQYLVSSKWPTKYVCYFI